MRNVPSYVRPTLSEALNAWIAVLAERGLPTELLWIFDENLCFETKPAGKEPYRLGFQTRFTPPPPDAVQIAYDHFCEFETTVVFYRVGSWRGKSICLVLCDDWFESKGEPDGYLRREDWRLAFRPGGRDEVEEITDEQRWRGRIIRNRPLHDLDFCMTLQGVHEILAHGRMLSSYEHYALRLMGAWRRLVAHGD
jgi:hypothetical protein